MTALPTITLAEQIECAQEVLADCRRVNRFWDDCTPKGRAPAVYAATAKEGARKEAALEAILATLKAQQDDGK